MSMFRGAAKAWQRYLAEVKKANDHTRITTFFNEEIMLWDFSKPESVDYWDCICDNDLGGHSYATFEPNSKGGAFLIHLNKSLLYEYLARNKDRNHLYVVENLLRDKLTKIVSTKCHMYSYITTTGAISVVLEAINAGDHGLCHTAILHLQGSVSKAASKPKFNLEYGMLEPEGWVRVRLQTFQHTVLEPLGYVENEKPGGIDKTYLNVDKYIYSASTASLASHFHTLLFSVMLNF